MNIVSDIRIYNGKTQLKYAGIVGLIERFIESDWTDVPAVEQPGDCIKKTGVTSEQERLAKLQEAMRPQGKPAEANAEQAEPTLESLKDQLADAVGLLRAYNKFHPTNAAAAFIARQEGKTNE